MQVLGYDPSLSPWQSDVLPIRLYLHNLRHAVGVCREIPERVRVDGYAPSIAAWKAVVLLLHQTRKLDEHCDRPFVRTYTQLSFSVGLWRSHLTPALLLSIV